MRSSGELPLWHSPQPFLCHAVHLLFGLDPQILLDETEAGTCWSCCELMLAVMVQEPPGEDDRGLQEHLGLRLQSAAPM